MGVEVYINRKFFLESRYDCGGFQRVDKSRHIFERDNLGAQSLHGFRFLYKIIFGED